MTHKLKDPGSAITHLIGMILAAIVSIPLIIKSFLSGDYVRIISLIIFTLSMIGLYGASTAYHSFNISPRINKKLKKLDHAMIFVLIAGSYTPICTIVLGGKIGYGLLSVIWAIAILGIDQLSEVVFLSVVYRNGMALYRCDSSDHSFAFPHILWMAACWWNHLYCWRCNLCT